VRIDSQEQLEAAAEQYEEQGSHLENVSFTHADFNAPPPLPQVAAESATAQMVNQAMASSDDVTVVTRSPDDVPKVGRNDPCPCGSGKKYKNCHGKLA
jgi:preprotein translocase subunit SecA